MFRVKDIILAVSLMMTISFSMSGQYISAAYSDWDDRLDTWNIFLDEDIILVAQKMSNRDPYQKWNLDLYDATGELWYGTFELVRPEDRFAWILNWNNERIRVESVYFRDDSVWKIVSEDQYFIIRAEDQYQNSWYHRGIGFEWKMYTANHNDIRDWYIDDNSIDEISFPMRLAAVLIILQTNIELFGF